MSEIDIVCPRCGETLEASDEVRGSSIECPSCHAHFVVPRDAMPPPLMPSAPQSLPPPFPTRPGHAAPQYDSAVLYAGWICLGIGLFLMVVLFVIPVWGPLVVASLVLGIIATAKGEKGGILLLITSLVVPPIVGSLAFLIVLGGCAAAVDSEMKKQGLQFPPPPARPAKAAVPAPAGKASAPAVPTPPVEVTPVRVLNLGNVLAQLDAVGQKYKTAQTSLQKEEFRKKAQEFSGQMFKNSRMTVRAVIGDVTMPREGVARISYHSLDMDAFGEIKDTALRIDVPGYVEVGMPRENALRLTPGTPVEMTGAPVFRPSSGNMLSDRAVESSAFLSVGLRTDPKMLGSIDLQDLKFRVAVPKSVPKTP